jgi:transcriptional regulator with XRE-family HTH domain
MNPYVPAIDRLRDLVDRSGLTRTEVAGRAGMSPGMITRLLSGARDPSITTVSRVLIAIRCNWADLDTIR